MAGAHKHVRDFLDKPLDSQVLLLGTWSRSLSADAMASKWTKWWDGVVANPTQAASFPGRGKAGAYAVIVFFCHFASLTKWSKRAEEVYEKACSALLNALTPHEDRNVDPSATVATSVASSPRASLGKGKGKGKRARDARVVEYVCPYMQLVKQLIISFKHSHLKAHPRKIINIAKCHPCEVSPLSVFCYSSMRCVSLYVSRTFIAYFITLCPCFEV